ncbi:efflux transporter outer membrane subunit [Methylocapsa palsarum]|uniref:Efflux transporter, outer membrane factor (OMF) lipoprotein, NodT family n=1 Tax=Methylocapsa palsarum TaxID=1612308 RepID=A0A1I4CQ55_9HYPH|nr:efflux transporter outer membrane subunit [Methylocapsa palsarum]SFK82770.1 efflux transporter, outer membrane factor (OMF) lipoprotein, NodT family [Methylocapsa palsarum]
MTSLNHLRRRAAAFALAAGVCGCAVGPNFEPPPPPEATRFTPERTASPGNGQHFVEGADVARDWWRAFGSKPLDDLVRRAIAQNPTLDAAEAAIRVAYYAAEAQKGVSLPQISANSLSQSGVASNAIPSDPATQLTYSLFTKQIIVSFTPDIWGANSRSVESLEAQTQIQQLRLEAAYLALAANVVATAIEEASLRGQINAARNIVAIEKELLQLLRRQLASGSVSGADLLSQEAALAQAEEILPPLEKRLAQQRNLLTALAGQYSGDEIAETFDLRRLTLPRAVPLVLPAQLVARRPDIQAAQANIHSAGALVGVAVAARLPNIMLSANGGSSALNFGQLFAPGTGFYVLAASATQPIFDGMTLLNKQKAAEAGLGQAEAQYRSVVINAFENVADALRALQVDARAVQAAAKAEEAARRSLDIVRLQARFGHVNQLAVLNAQQTYLQASIARVIADSDRLSDTAALFMAIGGGW